MPVLDVVPRKSVIGVAEGIERTYTSTYWVYATKDVGPLTVAATNPIPEYGDYYRWENDIDIWATVKSIDLDYDPDEDVMWKGQPCHRFVVVVTFDSNPDSELPQIRKNPLDDPPLIGGTFDPYRRTVFRDKDDQVIENVNKQALLPGVERDDAYDTLTIQLNSPTIDLQFRAEHRGTVNELAMWGLQARQIKMTRWGWTVKRRGKSFRYVQNNFEFRISYTEHPTQNVAKGPVGAIGWYETRPHVGFEYVEYGFDGTGTPAGYDPTTQSSDDLLVRTKKFTDGEGNFVNEPQPLALNGDRLEPNLPKNWVVTAVEKEKDFLLIPRMPTVLTL